MKDSQKNINKKVALTRRLFKKNPKVTVDQIQTSIKAEGFKYGLSPETIKEIKQSVLGLKEKNEGLTKTAPTPETNNQALTGSTTGFRAEEETDSVQETSPKMGTARSAVDRAVGSLTSLHGKVNTLTDKVETLSKTGGLTTEDKKNLMLAFLNGATPLVEVVSAMRKQFANQTDSLELIGKLLGSLQTEVSKNSKTIGGLTGTVYKLNGTVSTLDKNLSTSGVLNISEIRRGVEDLKKAVSEIQQIVGTPILLGEIDTPKISKPNGNGN